MLALVLHISFHLISRCQRIAIVALLGSILANSTCIAKSVNHLSIEGSPGLSQEFDRNVALVGRYLDQHALADQAVDARWLEESKALLVRIDYSFQTRVKDSWKQFVSSDLFSRCQKQFRQAQQLPGQRHSQKSRSAAPLNASPDEIPAIAASPTIVAVRGLALVPARDWVGMQRLASRQIGKTLRELDSCHTRAGKIFAQELFGLAGRVGSAVARRSGDLLANWTVSPESAELAFLDGANSVEAGRSKSSDYWLYYADCDRWQVEFEFEPVDSSR